MNEIAPNPSGTPRVRPDDHIVVSATEGGWSVANPLSIHPLLFLSAETALHHAQALAERLAGAGRDARVMIEDSSHALMRTVRYFASEA